MKFLIVIGEQTYEVDVENTGEECALATGDASQPAEAPIQSAVLPTPPETPAAGSDIDETKVCRSPVAGVVTQVKAQTGDRLSKDDLVVVLEAMKMETSLRAPITGNLKCVNVAPGDAVKVNQILLEFE